MNRKIIVLGIVGLTVAGLFAAPVGAQPDTAPTTATPDNGDEEDGDDEENSGIDLSGVTGAIDDLIGEITDFTGSWDEELKDILFAVLFNPFRTLAQQLLQALATILMHTPEVYPNPAVEEVHTRVLIVTYLLSGVGFMTAGLLYITGPLLGVSYSEIRMVLPRMTAALIFSSASLPLLQYTIDLTNALVTAFAPNQLTMTITQLAGLSTALVIVVVVESALLLVLVTVFIIRGVYILFIAAISPLLALTWSIPRAKRYADSFIAGWWTALAMAPLDMLVLRFSFALLEGNGGDLTTTVSNWIFGVAAFTLLILVPYQLYGASQAAIGHGYSISKGIKSRAKQAYRHHRGKTRKQGFKLNSDEQNRLKSYRHRKQQQNSDGFRSNWGDKNDD